MVNCIWICAQALKKNGMNFAQFSLEAEKYAKGNTKTSNNAAPVNNNLSANIFDEYRKNLLYNVKDEVRMVEEITPSYLFNNRQKIINNNIKIKVRHLYYTEYIKLQKICIMILTHKMMNFEKNNLKIYGLLFDCASLWEEYLNKLLHSKNIFYHPNNRIKGKNSLAQNLFRGYKNEDERKKGIIYPDFIGRNVKIES